MNRPIYQLLTVLGMPLMLIGGILSEYNAILSVIVIVFGALLMVGGALGILQDL